MTKKILIVDDEKNIVESEREILEEEGFKVISAYDGKEALKKIRKELPDLMILDINMPKVDGYEVCKRIEQNPSYMSLPVIISTGEKINKTDMERLHFIKGYISKPFDYKELVSKVNEVFQKEGK